MPRWTLSGFLILLAVSLVGVTAPGNARHGQRKRDVVGYVNLTRLTDALKGEPEYQAKARSFEEKRSRYRNQIEDLARLRFLSLAEAQKLRFLRLRNEPTAQQKERIGELEAKSSRLDTEYQRLVVLEKLDAADTRRLKELTALREATGATIIRDPDRTAQQLQKEESNLLELLETRIRAAVQQLARKHDLAMVIDQQAVLDGGRDLTEEVLKQFRRMPR